MKKKAGVWVLLDSSGSMRGEPMEAAKRGCSAFLKKMEPDDVVRLVASARNLVPVQTNGVHVHDEGLGIQPRWSFSATIQSDADLLRQPNKDQTLKARLILSWELPPTSCSCRPI